MKHSLTVAAWEIKKIVNKSFLLSLLLTPALILMFTVLPGLLGQMAADRQIRLYVVDELGVYQSLVKELEGSNIIPLLYMGERADLENSVRKEKDTAYIVLSPLVMTTRQVAVKTTNEGLLDMTVMQSSLQRVLRQYELAKYGLSPEIIANLETPFSVSTVSLAIGDAVSPMRNIVLGIFVGIMFFVASTTGMLIMQSALTEKRDRLAEVLLSSVSAGSVMLGKILGCLVPSLLQAFLWVVSGLLFARFYYDLTVWHYLLDPRMPLLLFFLLGGYLFFSAMFISLGATMDDPMQASNYQGVVMMTPYLPFLFMGSVIADPNGLVARLGSYFPLTTAGVMLTRLVVADTVILTDIALSGVLLLATTALMVWAAGKIFQTGFLLYGKEATPLEIIRWLRS
ncbi:MAG: ABC transporter permease [Firmicutes bacterium]|nr:ABC transporter permease [Bacillota bacterium]